MQYSSYDCSSNMTWSSKNTALSENEIFENEYPKIWDVDAQQGQKESFQNLKSLQKTLVEIKCRFYFEKNSAV